MSKFVPDSMNLISSLLVWLRMIDVFCYSCTVIQVWGTLIMQKRYHGPDYLLAFLVTLGCSVFILYPVIVGSLSECDHFLSKNKQWVPIFNDLMLHVDGTVIFLFGSKKGFYCGHVYKVAWVRSEDIII